MVKRERKVFDMPGQTKDTPPEVLPFRFCSPPPACVGPVMHPIRPKTPTAMEICNHIQQQRRRVGFQNAINPAATLEDSSLHPQTDSLRKFYTSLRQQRPDSEMARKW